MNTATTYTPEALEAEIAATGRKMEREYAHGHKAQARVLMDKIRVLVAQRSPETAEAMERERGLS
jgi:hypothetical protein